MVLEKFGSTMLFIATVAPLILLSATAKPSSNMDCQNLNVSLTQKIDGEGFHKEINWLIEHSSTSFKCKLAIKWNVGVEMYLSPDQIADLNRLGHINMIIEGNVDVEAPSHLAAEHTAYVFIPAFEEKVSINVPFHLRYQRAQIGGGFGKVVLNKPSVLAICPESCGKTEVKAPCDDRSTFQCGWNNVSYQAFFNEVEMLVPVGNLDDYPMVSIVTLLLGCAGCIYTLSVLSTTPL